MKRGQDRISSRSDAEWAALDPVLAEGEIALTLGAGRYKYGNGVQRWSEIAFQDAPFAKQSDVAAVASDAAGTRGQLNGVRQQINGINDQIAALTARVTALETASSSARA